MIATDLAFGFLMCFFLIFLPDKVAKFLGNVYWIMSRFTLMDRNEKNKKKFFAENTLWFRALGLLFLILIGYGAWLKRHT